MNFVLILVAYLIGSVPTAVWAGKWFHGIDLRNHGSGNAGATNAFRVLGKKTAMLVLLIDMLKGMAAVSLSVMTDSSAMPEGWFAVFRFGLGMAALVGHVFPIYAGFRGGKGIATLTGIVIVLFPSVVMICVVVFLVAFLITRYVSLGSILAALTFPLAMLVMPGTPLLPELIFALVVAVFVPLTHIKNIKRLIRGKENKISFRSSVQNQSG